ncbi:MAG: lipoprotein-releasing system ATP-binding protein LolD [Anaerolinea sp.]|nr:lipoprotein-releasing system ATP-binding protein LolD [Anaerolinea sp.]
MVIIEARELTKIYGSGDTAITALDHVSLKVNEGEFVAVMGSSGCGKSTLLNLLGGLDKATDGQTLVESQPLDQLTDDALSKLRRQKIGFVFQFYNLIPVLTVVENAALPVTLDGMPEAAAHEKTRHWIDKVGLIERAASHPNQLSGGQQQRVAIARALVAEPKLILADEPTGNLDSHSADEIAGLLRIVANEWGRAVIMVTHDAHIASYANRLIFLKDGAILFDHKRPENTLNGADWVLEMVRGYI